MPRMAKPSAAENVQVKLRIASSWGRVLLICCLGLILLPLVIQHSDSVNQFFASTFVSEPPIPVAVPELQHESTASLPPPEVEKLLASLRDASSKASRGAPTAGAFSDGDRTRWERSNPCRSREELTRMYGERKHIRDVPRNRPWELVFREYEELHRNCMSRVGDLGSYLRSGNSSIPGCKFVLADSTFGLGNKLYHISSVFLFAILSQRVILVPESTSIPSVMCEPFAGSSWRVEQELVDALKERRKSTSEFMESVDREEETGKKGGFGVYASEVNDVWGPDARFWCDTEQEYMSSVTWLSIDGCNLFLGKLHAIDMYRPTLEALFPERIALTYILRSLLLPADPIWERVLHVNEVYLRNAAKQVGIQVRFFQGETGFAKKNDLINDRITRCLWKHGVLPQVCPSSPTHSSDPSSCSEKLNPDHHQHPRITKVLIASLFLGLHDHLNDYYLRHDMTTTKEAVGVVQLTHEKLQGTGAAVDGQALVEILSLSLSDVLLVTPMSTFGGVAQAYGGLIPWFIEFGDDDDSARGDNSSRSAPEPCERGMGIEPCFLGGDQHYNCKYDPPGKQKVFDLVPYLRDCSTIDIGYGHGLGMMPEGFGMQLVPDRREDQDFTF